MRSTRLKQVATVTLGKMLHSGQPSDSSALRPYLKASSITEAGLDLEKLQTMPFTPRESSTLDLCKGDVVVVEGGSIGKSAYLPDDLPHVHFQNSVNRVRAHEGVDGRFLNYCIVDARASGYFEAVTNQATIRHLTAEKLADMPLMLPASDAQRLIADYLDHETAEIDAFIDEQQQLSTLVAERLSAACESAIVSSGVSEVQLRRLSPMRSSGTSVNGSPWPARDGTSGVLKTGAASKGFFDAHENKEVTDPSEIPRLSAPVIGDRVLVNRANTPALVGGSVYVARSFTGLYLSDKLWSIDFDASNEYMSLALSTRRYRDQVSLLSVGASASMHNLSYEDFLSIRLPVPAPAAQSLIAEQLRATRTVTSQTHAAIAEAIDLAKERRAALVSAAVTGQIDVTGRRHGPSEAERLEEEVSATR